MPVISEAESQESQSNFLFLSIKHFNKNCGKYH